MMIYIHVIKEGHSHSNGTGQLQVTNGASLLNKFLQGAF